MTCRSTVSLCLALTLTVAAAPSAEAAQEGFGGNISLPAGAAINLDRPATPTGAFTHSISIEVPRFYGLAPALSLSFSSRAAQNSFVGLGWSLSGIDTIERRGPSGAPTYGTNDTFSWNGEPLVPYTALGGTHATKRQSFMRITQSGSNWIVTDKGGVRRIYTPVLTTSKGTFRWGLSQVIDLHGNTTTYNWATDGTYDAYPSTITYHGNTITLNRELRADAETFPTGAGAGSTRYRLSSIVVQSAGASVRTYTMSYGTNGSGKSRLQRVSQTGLPDTVFSYQTDSSGTAPRLDPPVSWWSSSGGPTGFENFTTQQGDFNGDGKVDFCLHYRTGNTVYTYVSLSNGNGTFATPVWWMWTGAPPVTSLAQWKMSFADFNGDGRLDLMLSTGANTAAGYGSNTFFYYTAFGNGVGGFNNPSLGAYTLGALPTDSWNSCVNLSSYQVETGDYNGDGRMDARLYCSSGPTFPANGNYSQAYSYVFPSNGGATFAAPQYWNAAIFAGFGSGASLPYYGVQAADYNGDGKTDFRFHYRTGNSVYSYTVLAAGNGTFYAPVYWSNTVPGSDLSAYKIDSGDYNGDRKMDFRLYSTTAGLLSVTTFLADGAGGYGMTQWQYSGSPANGDWTRYWDMQFSPYSADFDGDGTTDLVWSYADGSVAYTYVAYSKADGTYQNPQLIYSASVSFAGYAPIIGDYNADGRTDVLLLNRAGTYASSSVLFGSAKKDWPALLSLINYWAGGSTTISYADHTSGKVLAQVAHNDGKGGPPITQSYSFIEPYLKDAGEPREIGFRQVRVTDAANNFTDTYFFQGASFPVGMTERVQRFAYGNNGALADRLYTVDQSTSVAPYVRLVVASDEAQYGANRHTTTGYDGYGNVTSQVFQNGERAHAVSYYNDWSYYVVDRVSAESVTGNNGGMGSSVTMVYSGGTWDLSSKTVGGIATTTYTYDTMGNQTSVRDPDGNTTVTSYLNASNQPDLYPTSVTNALNQVARQAWDPVCQVPSSSTDVNARQTTYQYDALCRRTLEQHVDGSWVSTAYNNFGTPGSQHVYSSASDGGQTGLYTRTYFDGLGREWKTEKRTAAADLASIRAFDNVGHVASQTVDGLVTTLLTDALGNVYQTTQPDQSTVRVARSGWTLQSIDELGNSTTSTTDAYGNVVLVQDPSGTTTIIYDPANRLWKITDALQYQTSIQYDAAGRKRSIADPDSGTWTYAPDAAGNVVTQTDARGVVTTMTYDALNRLKTRSAGTRLTTMYYDEAGFGDSIGRMTRVTDPSGSTVMFYDSMGRPSQDARVIGGKLYNTWHTYDLAGRPALLTYPDGETIGYSYDGGGGLIRVGNYVTSGLNNARGQLISRHLCNSVNEAFSYDPYRNWLKTWSSSSVQTLNLNYDPRGSVTSLTGGPADWGYAYDALGRIASSSGPYPQSFAYAANGRMTSQTNVGGYAYNAANQGGRAHAPYQVGSTGLAYDANGNMLSGGGHSYTYDEENHVSSIDGMAIVYNGLGERVRAGNTNFVGTLYEDDGSAPKKYYYFGKARIARRDGPTSIYYYHADQVGSIGAITDRFGVVAKREVLSPYGHVVSTAGTLADPFGLGGARFEGGVYQMGARYMDPELAIFTSADPSGDPDPKVPGKLNRYAYAYGVPTKYIDPTGYEGEEPYDFGFTDSSTVIGTYPRVNVDNVIGGFLALSLEGVATDLVAGAALGTIAATRIGTAVTSRIVSMPGVPRVFNALDRAFGSSAVSLGVDGMGGYQASSAIAKQQVGAIAENTEEIYDNFFYGTCASCALRNLSRVQREVRGGVASSQILETYREGAKNLHAVVQATFRDGTSAILNRGEMLSVPGALTQGSIAREAGGKVLEVFDTPGQYAFDHSLVRGFKFPMPPR